MESYKLILVEKVLLRLLRSILGKTGAYKNSKVSFL